MMSTVMTQGLEKMLFLYHSQFFQQKVFSEKLLKEICCLPTNYALMGILIIIVCSLGIPNSVAVLM